MRPIHELHCAGASVLSSVVAMACVVGCSSPRTRTPVPEAYLDIAEVPGIPRARFWGDELPADIEARIAELRAKRQTDASWGNDRTGSYLAVSGGGANGAFGAGLLIGWTAAGDRPRFDLVTGISTGALTAPLAYLGPDYDPQLREVYTTVSTKDVLEQRGMISGLTSDAFADSTGLQRLIARYVDEAFVAAIAREHEEGRWLLVGTTNLDAGRPVVWNIGNIAASGSPQAVKLIRSILLASASIPGAFPPVYIEVEANGERYDEMHVDGSASAQVFLYPAALDWRRIVDNFDLKKPQTVYVLRNSFLMPQWEGVEAKLAPIIGRALDTLIKVQGVGDLYRIYLGAQRDGIEFRLAAIPEDFGERPKEPFDPEYMQRLFDLGYNLAKSGYPWDKTPPGMEPP